LGPRATDVLSQRTEKAAFPFAEMGLSQVNENIRRAAQLSPLTDPGPRLLSLSLQASFNLISEKPGDGER
jgi:hypothetical protein